MRPDAAFIFADLVGFTSYTEREGDEAAADLAIAFCNAICELNQGHNAKDVKMIGDASLIRAPNAVAGINLGLHIVDRIGPEHGFPLVRVGMDVGPAVERDGDWFGSTINMAARIVALAPESSVLITERTRLAARHHPKVEFEDCGASVLRGVLDPVRLYIAKRNNSSA